MQEQELRSDWLSKKILIVGGKGGVGKSLIAASAAQEAARDGRRVLLVELGETSYYKDFWKLDQVSHQPRRLKQGFDLAIWSGETCLREYVLHYLKLDRLYSAFFENKVMRSLIGVAPGLAEIAMIGKVTSGIRRVGPPLDYDLIVVDGFSTGHARALLRAPRGMADAIPFGPMGAQSREIDLVLRDSKLTCFWTVALLEELPTAETIEYAAMLESDLHAKTRVIANKTVAPPSSEAELRELSKEGSAEAPEKSDVAEFSRYLLAVMSRQNLFINKLKAAGLNPVLAPLVYSSKPEELLLRVGEALRTS